MNDLLECIGDRIRWRISCNVQVVVRWMALGVNINSTEEGTAGGSSSVEESNCIGYLLCTTSTKVNLYCWLEILICMKLSF